MSSITPRFTNEKLFRYPHMFPLDIAIWDRFLDKHADDFIGFDYDVKVGTGIPAEPGTPENYARMQEILSKYRIDVVGYDSSTIYIIEVKPEAGTTAIGQITTYTTLYQRDLAPPQAIKGVIVTDRELPDIRELTETLGIDYYIV